jgi:hypothetical protein
VSPISAKEYLEGHVKGAAEFLAAFKRENPTAVATVDLILGLVLVEGRQRRTGFRLGSLIRAGLIRRRLGSGLWS